ncbi:MAG: hypothetical protein LIO97_06345 [Tannerellaceae bacterium]|nr:hypothetical protein [Tannerellaceae bacterium]
MEATILKIGKDHKLKTDSIYIFESEYTSDIMYGERIIHTVTDQDATWHNLNRDELAAQYVPVITTKILELKREHNILQVAKRITLFLLVILIQYFLFKGTNYLFRKLRRQIIWLMQNRLHPITIREYEFLNTHRQGKVLIFSSNIIRYIFQVIS